MGQIQHLLAVVLQGLAADRACLGLQANDQAAVVERVGQPIAAAGHRQIVGQLQIQLKPLAQVALVLQHAHMGP